MGFLLLVGAASAGVNFLDYAEMRAWRVVSSLYDRRGLPVAGFYLLTHVACVVALIALLASRYRAVRVFGLAFVFVGVWVDLGTKAILGHPFGFPEASTVLTVASLTGDYLENYATHVGVAGGWSALVVAGAWLVFKLSRLELHGAWLVALPLGFGLAYSVVWRTVTMTDSYPAPIRVPVLLAYAVNNSLYTGERAPVSLEPGPGPRAAHVILIVDESIRADYLGINGAPRDTTLFLRTVESSYLNFGTASAASNLSSTSNLVLQTGLRLGEIPDRAQAALRRANVFDFATRAGYKTYFLDAQSAPGVLANYMRKRDLDALDGVYQLGGRASHRADRELIPIIDSLLRTEPRTFIYVNKAGAHIPYANAYPPGSETFKPTVTGMPFTVADREALRNTYANAVIWSVDAFFEALLGTIPLADTVIIYTSDHGQSLLEGGLVTTHGDWAHSPAVQANVPLLVFGVPDTLSDLVAGVTAGTATRDKASHFQIFPSLLSVMGYPPSAVVDRYGPRLWEPASGPRRFVSGDVFGRGVVRINEF